MLGDVPEHRDDSCLQHRHRLAAGRPGRQHRCDSSPFQQHGLVRRRRPGGTGDLVVHLNSTAAGVLHGFAEVALYSHDSAQGDVLIGKQQVTLTGTVESYGSAAFLEAGGGATITGGGSNYLLNFGTLLSVGQAVTADVFITDDAPTPADPVSGTFNVPGVSGAFSNTDFTGVAGVGSGAPVLVGTVVFNPSQVSGTTATETITLMPTGTPVPPGRLAARDADGAGPAVRRCQVAASATLTYDASSPSTMNLGDVHVGHTVEQAVTLSNYSSLSSVHTLEATIDVTAGLITTGTIAALAPHVADGVSLKIGLNGSSSDWRQVRHRHRDDQRPNSVRVGHRQPTTVTTGTVFNGLTTRHGRPG